MIKIIKLYEVEIFPIECDSEMECRGLSFFPKLLGDRIIISYICMTFYFRANSILGRAESLLLVRHVRIISCFCLFIVLSYIYKQK